MITDVDEASILLKVCQILSFEQLASVLVQPDKTLLQWYAEFLHRERPNNSETEIKRIRFNLFKDEIQQRIIEAAK